MAVKKSRKFPGFLIYSRFKDSAFTAAKSNVTFQTRYLKGAPFVNGRYWVREGYLFSQKKYIEGNELDLKAEPRRGGYFRNFWVGMCGWDPGTLNLYQS